jgi:N-methylhydantoinase A
MSVSALAAPRDADRAAGPRDAPILIGVDVGGTHTDTCVAAGDRLVRAKAFTTHDDYSQGLIDALAVAAGRLDRSLDELLSGADALVNGTTVVTNALTELRGARVGVITTRGFRDTLRFAGGARRPVYDDQLQVSPPDVAPRDCILEVDERVTKDGSVLVELDEPGVREAIAQLRARGAETLAVCFLWSFRNPAHEQRVRELALEQWPDVFITLSSEIHPVIREHERFFSAVFNSYCQPAARRLLRTVSGRLNGHGFAGKLTFFSGAGGAIPGALAERFPLLLLASGPAGGVRGAIDLAQRMGLDDVLVGDMGGTSFDTTLVQAHTPRIASRLKVAGLPTGINVVDVVSIGAGGGSIAWADARGVPQVGPHSAGSTPGPACYGRGGDQPTVTDATLVAGIIDPGSYLDGRVTLDRDASRRVIADYGQRFGWSLEATTDAILQLTVANMAEALRTVTVERGHDPSRLVLIGYGGTLPMFAAAITERLHMSRVVLPANSSVFSAFGVLMAPFSRRYTRSLQMGLHAEGVAEEVEAVRAEMRALAAQEAEVAGIGESELTLSWGAELRFGGQVSELDMPLGPEPFTAATAKSLIAAFPARYESFYGAGTAWQGSPVVLVNLILTSSAPRPRPNITAAAARAGDAAASPSSRRRVLMDGGVWRDEVPVYDGTGFLAGMRVDGPAIVDEHDTTILVPQGWSARRDEWRSCVLEHRS